VKEGEGGGELFWCRIEHIRCLQHLRPMGGLRRIRVRRPRQSQDGHLGAAFEMQARKALKSRP
jgi:hypothetical protein